MTARKGTYSIVARDPDTGELGVAVQSHWFSVGSIVSWAEPGVGAVATQSIAEPAYGPRLLDRLRGGQAPGEALDELLAHDQQARVRQVSVVDSQGAVAVQTGSAFVPGAATPLVDTRITAWERSNHGSQYAATADGERFLVNNATDTTLPITLVLNWTAALKK